MNPDCTPGWVEEGVFGSGYISFCGCGWSEAGHESKSQAKAAQKIHRFPPGEPPELLVGSAPERPATELVFIAPTTKESP